MERQLARNPTTVEVRVHCLDMAVRGAQLMGRADGLLQLAEQYFEWCTRGAQPTESKPTEPQLGDDAGPIGDGGQGDGNDGKGAGGDGDGGAGQGPASLRQGQGKGKDK